MRSRNEILSIIGGMLTAILLSVLASALMILLFATFYSSTSTLLPAIFLFLFNAIGLFQIVYILPYAIKLRRKGRIAKMKGLIIGAVIVALVSGACWISLFNIK